MALGALGRTGRVRRVGVRLAVRWGPPQLICAGRLAIQINPIQIPGMPSPFALPSLSYPDLLALETREPAQRGPVARELARREAALTVALAGTRVRVREALAVRCGAGYEVTTLDGSAMHYDSAHAAARALVAYS